MANESFTQLKRTSRDPFQRAAGKMEQAQDETLGGREWKETTTRLQDKKCCSAETSQ